MDDTIIPLADEFEAPSRGAWLAIVEKTLKGGPFDQLISRTADGLPIQPLYTAADARPSPARPGLRDPAQPWDVRMAATHPDPLRANADILKDLESGATSALLKIDPSGQAGVAIASADDLAQALSGVLLDLAPIALDAGFLGPQAADWLGALAKSAPAAPLALHLDPLSAFARSGASPGPIESHLVSAATVAARLAEPYPKASLFLASGQAVHEAGGTEAQELGFMAATALAYAKALTRAGLPLADAFPRIVLGLTADGEYFTTIAKLRAARLIWAKLAGACGVEAPARIEARSSARMLTRQDPWVNLLRLTAAGFGAATGGADAIVLSPFTDALGLATPFARRQARNTQLVLMEEAHLGRVADPAGGAWFLESLTDDLARAGWAAFQAIEAEGGIVAALSSGRFAGDVAAARTALETALAEKKTAIVGVTKFPDPHPAPVEVETVDLTAFAKQGPNPKLPGPDGRCAALPAFRLAEPFESAQAATVIRS